MGIKSRREYLQTIIGRYQRVGRLFKSKILDEFCAVCGYWRPDEVPSARELHPDFFKKSPGI